MIRREKRESLLRAEFDHLLGVLCTPEWTKGVAGLLQLLENELVLDKPDEFLELRKSIFYNVALIYKDKGQNLASLYFFMQTHKLSPDNVSLLAEMGMLCRKELRLPQALYYFELALSMESSQTNRLLFAEQIIVLRYCLDKNMSHIVTYLRSCGYKMKELAELSDLLASGLLSCTQDDFLSDSFGRVPSVPPSRQGWSPYIQKMTDLKQEWHRRNTLLGDGSPDDQDDSQETEAPVIPICLGKLKWKEVLSVLLVLMRIHSLEKKGLQDAAIRQHVEAMGAYRWLGTIDVDIFESKFRVDLQETEQTDKKMVVEQLPVGPRREDVPRTPMISGQMALREKKPVFSKAGVPGETVGFLSSDPNMTGGFDGMMTRIHNCGMLDQHEKNFYFYEVSQLYQLNPHGPMLNELAVESCIKELNKKTIEDTISQDNLANSGEKTKLANLTLTDIEQLEEADLVSFHTEHLKNKTLTFRELCFLVFEHLLSVKPRQVQGSQLSSSEFKAHGPSPLLYFAE